jgi:hypothetical protein
MDGLPRRGDAVAQLDLPLPPGQMPLLRRERPLKRWRYFGVYGPDVMLCAGRARVGVIPKAWWAIVERDRPVRERARGIRFDGSRLLIESGGVRSAGVGRGVGGERIGWNLVTGVNDGPVASERTVWVDGEPVEVGPVEFADDLSRVGELAFHAWPDSARVDDTNLLVFRSRYRQPFGSFSGTLPDGTELAEGWGVMESHDVTW